MKLFKSIILAIALILPLTGCFQRISTGEIGVAVNMSKQIQQGELLPGSWNQTLTQDVLTFPTKDITVTLDNKTPMTADNSALADFDVSIVYSINPSSVAELYSTKAKGFHLYDEKEKDTFLMYNYMTTLVNNASYKAIRKFNSLEAADNRVKIEADIRDIVNEQLKTEKLETAMSVNVVQVRNILPNADILRAATDLVRSANELKIKDNEVNIARKEAEKQKLLAENGPQTIAYMNAQASMVIANAVAAGKVQTIILSSDTKAILNLGK